MTQQTILGTELDLKFPLVVVNVLPIVHVNVSCLALNFCLVNWDFFFLLLLVIKYVWDLGDTVNLFLNVLLTLGWLLEPSNQGNICIAKHTIIFLIIDISILADKFSMQLVDVTSKLGLIPIISIYAAIY